MTAVIVHQGAELPVGKRAIEIVERKGLGHPDTICDCVMESISVALCAAYRQTVGRVLHHNLDKGLLVAGQTTPALRGGRVEAPMRLVIGDRATSEWQGVKIPVQEIAEATAAEWFRRNLRHVDPSRHVVFQNELKPGSPELTDIFARQRLSANDTSVGVGYAPLSETEQIVLETERFLNSSDFKSRHPESGEDVKVMGVRRGDELQLTVAIAFIDRMVSTAKDYFAKKERIAAELKAHCAPLLKQIGDMQMTINALDAPQRGVGGMYLTVLGTSAEGADGGEVGRGNRVNGLITFNRPMSLEAAAGKNPVSHVGKIYNLWSRRIAERIHAELKGIEEVYVWMCSRIGTPLDEPWCVAVDFVSSASGVRPDFERPIQDLVDDELRQVETLIQRICRGELSVC